MKTLYFICCLCCLSFSSFSQYIVTTINENAFLKNADGSFIQKTTSYVEEGFSTLPATNTKVVLITKNGKVYRNVNGRIDLMSGGFIYSMNDQEFLCELPIEKIVFDSDNTAFAGALFKTGYPSVDKQNEKTFYEILSDGKASLLKYHGVIWQDIIPFYNTNTLRIFTPVEKYYLYLNGKMIRLEKSKDKLAFLLPSTKEFITKNNLNLKKQEDAIKLVDYYNSL